MVMRISRNCVDGSLSTRVVHYMPTNFGMTGVETFILQLSSEQKRSGLTPSIAMDLIGRDEVRSTATEHGIEVLNLPGMKDANGKWMRRFAKAWLGLKRVRILWK